MPKHKLFRIQAVKSFSNVSHAPEELLGNWASLFGNSNPITVELGCGRGDLLLTLAQQHPQRNYVGVDLKGVRLWPAATMALKNNIHNVYFIRTNILDLPSAFEQGDVSEIWITFPDPYPKKRRKRMTATRYLDVYSRISKPAAPCHLKTDDDDFFKFSLKSLRDYGCTILSTIEDVHAQPQPRHDLQILTAYEKRHIAEGRTIKYIHFTLPKERGPQIEQRTYQHRNYWRGREHKKATHPGPAGY